MWPSATKSVKIDEYSDRILVVVEPMAVPVVGLVAVVGLAVVVVVALVVGLVAVVERVLVVVVVAVVGLALVVVVETAAVVDLVMVGLVGHQNSKPIAAVDHLVD